MTCREIAKELHFLRFRRAHIDDAIRALKQLQRLQAARCWDVGAIPAGAGMGRTFRMAAGGRTPAKPSSPPAAPLHDVEGKLEHAAPMSVPITESGQPCRSR